MRNFLGEIKDLFKESFKSIFKFAKDFTKEYRRLSEEEKLKKLSQKQSQQQTSFTKEEIQEMRETFEQFKEYRRSVQEQANISRLNPRRYQTKDELLIGILEEMGLNEQIKNSGITERTLIHIIKRQLEDLEIDGKLGVENFTTKQLADLTEQEVQMVKENLESYGDIKIDDDGNLEYVVKGDTKYIRHNLRIQEGNIVREYIHKNIDNVIADEEEKQDIEVESYGLKQVFNLQGIQMEEESHRVETEYKNLKYNEIVSKVDGTNESVSTISKLPNRETYTKKRENIVKASCSYFSNKGGKHVDRKVNAFINFSIDLANLVVNADLMEALKAGDQDFIQSSEDNYDNVANQYTDQDMKRFLEEKIEKSPKKEALRKMAQDEGLLDKDEARTNN